MIQEEKNLEYYNRTYKEVNGVLYKRCPKCEEWFIESKDNFYYQNGRSGTNCKKCEIKRSAKRQKLHPRTRNEKDIFNNRQKEFRHKPENLIKQKNNQDEQRKKGNTSRWQQNNPEKIKKYNAIYSNKKHTISNKEWEACKNYFKDEQGEWSCAYCGMSEDKNKLKYNQQLHKEHVDCEGKGNLQNCVPSCVKCNTSKHKDDIKEWYIKQEFFTEEKLNKIYKWVHEDYKQYEQEKEELPYIIKRIKNTNNTFHYELWSKNADDEPLLYLGTGNKKKDLNIYIEKLLLTI